MALPALLACAALPAQTPAPESNAPAAQAAPATASAAAPAANIAGDATAGQAKATTCAACHGLDGNPASPLYPKLAGQHESYITRQINLFKGRQRDNPIMMGFAMPLSDQDMHDIGAYFASKSSLPGVADTQLVARGEALYRGGDATTGTPACMACHAADGRGNPGAGYPQLAGQFADYVSLKLKDWQAGKTWGNDDRAKIMPMIAKTLSDADVAAVSSYIEGLHAASAGGAAAAR
jgi:cytochrome c553